MVTRVCRHCGAITEHQTAAGVKGRIACPECGRESVLLTVKQAEQLAESKRETERNNAVDFHCPRCKYHIVGIFKGKILCPQCHCLWNRSDDGDGVVLDKNWENRIISNRVSDRKSRSNKFKYAIEAAKIFNSGVLHFRTEKYMIGDMIGNTLCPLCCLFSERAYVTTIQDIYAHANAIPPFAPCRCPIVFGVEIVACYPDMYDKPNNVEFVDLDSVIETVELYKQVCSGKNNIPFESRLKIIPDTLEFAHMYTKIPSILGSDNERCDSEYDKFISIDDSVQKNEKGGYTFTTNIKIDIDALTEYENKIEYDEEQKNRDYSVMIQFICHLSAVEEKVLVRGLSLYF